MPKCESPSCTFQVHTNMKNNDGKHCCKICTRIPGRHGPRCEKVTHEAPVPEVPAPATN